MVRTRAATCKARAWMFVHQSTTKLQATTAHISRPDNGQKGVHEYCASSVASARPQTTTRVGRGESFVRCAAVCGPGTFGVGKSGREFGSCVVPSLHGRSVHTQATVCATINTYQVLFDKDFASASGLICIYRSQHCAALFFS